MRPKDTTPRPQFVRLCACGCGQPTNMDYRGLQPCRYLHNHHSKGAQNPRFKGEQHPALGPEGRHTPTHTYPSDGYTLCYVPDHPHATHNGYVFLHRLVVERALGRYLLPTERVDHIDHDRGNNTPDNLRVFASQGEHIRAAHGKGERWARDYAACVHCGGTRSPYAGNGQCRNCYMRLTRRAAGGRPGMRRH